MAYFIFNKNSDNLTGDLYKIAENQSDLNYINIEKSLYKIIEDNSINFNSIKNGSKIVEKYNGEVITYLDFISSFKNKQQLESYVSTYKNSIKLFLDNNPNHALFNRWNNYYNQLNNLNLDSINYPLNISLEQYFNDLGQTSYNILQLP